MGWGFHGVPQIASKALRVEAVADVDDESHIAQLLELVQHSMGDRLLASRVADVAMQAAVET